MLLFTLCFLGCLLFTPAARAQASATSISFQGVLNGANGQPLANNTYNLTFRFYASASTNGTVNGNAVTNVPGVAVTDGVVSAAVPVQPAWFDGQTRWLGISVNGANGLQPGMVMKAEGQLHAEGEYPVAMTGRVWCWADATVGGPVRRGDRLTTSATPGHAMRVGDESRSPGAVIGKAMTELESGTGLVLVLVNLQ